MLTENSTKFSKDNQPDRRGDPLEAGQANADKHLLSNALRLALHREVKDADGKPTKRLNMIAEKLARAAEGGDLPAIKEVFDRTEGKAPQAITHEGGDKPIDHHWQVEFVNATTESK